MIIWNRLPRLKKYGAILIFYNFYSYAKLQNDAKLILNDLILNCSGFIIKTVLEQVLFILKNTVNALTVFHMIKLNTVKKKRNSL